MAVTASLVFGTGAALAADPTVTVDPVATHGITTAHATGTITTDSEVFYYFEFTEAGKEEWNLGPEAFTRLIPADTNPQAVEEDLSGLKANTAYEVRLAASGLGTSASSAPFTTDPAPNAPALALDPAVPFYTSARLSGTVDPEGGNLNSPGNPVPIHWTIEISETGDPGTWGPVAEGDIVGAEAEGTAPIAIPPSAAEPTGLAPN
ncbi:MAG TPA: hypothetical protein VHP56_00585, partial [Solirubrobacterales bacterium]|nr:hypothetical protein [Solirubrobacterales bacterium]